MAKIPNILEGASNLFDSDSTFFNKKFIEKHFKHILIVVILMVSYIQLRYEYENHLINIGRLKVERNDLRYTCIEKWSILTEKNRPEKIRAKVAKSSVQLIESDERPVIVK